MPAKVEEAPVSDDEAAAFFSDFSGATQLVLAVSGGPDSTALMWLAARWRKKLRRAPKLLAVTVDHGLRPEAKAEAAAVAKFAAKLRIAHRTLRWEGAKPKTGIQQAAREARYRLLSQAAREAGARHVLTAHTLDDQAETVLFRLARGSGLAGLIGMTPRAPMPVVGATDIEVVRPLLTIPKSRLIATLTEHGIAYADDPSNRDPRFARPRFRALMPMLAAEGLTADRLALLSRRAERAETALVRMAVNTFKKLATPWPPNGRVTLDASFLRLPEALVERVLDLAIASIGQDEPIQLHKLESLVAALRAADPSRRFRRTLAGDMITLQGGILTVERAPPRRARRQAAK
jgi:tRNA(Ile)-lysidine synthase